MYPAMISRISTLDRTVSRNSWSDLEGTTLTPVSVPIANSRNGRRPGRPQPGSPDSAQAADLIVVAPFLGQTLQGFLTRRQGLNLSLLAGFQIVLAFLDF